MEKENKDKEVKTANMSLIGGVDLARAKEGIRAYDLHHRRHTRGIRADQ